MDRVRGKPSITALHPSVDRDFLAGHGDDVVAEDHRALARREQEDVEDTVQGLAPAFWGYLAEERAVQRVGVEHDVRQASDVADPGLVGDRPSARGRGRRVAVPVVVAARQHRPGGLGGCRPAGRGRLLLLPHPLLVRRTALPLLLLAAPLLCQVLAEVFERYVDAVEAAMAVVVGFAVSV